METEFICPICGASKVLIKPINESIVDFLNTMPSQILCKFHGCKGFAFPQKMDIQELWDIFKLRYDTDALFHNKVDQAVVIALNLKQSRNYRTTMLTSAGIALLLDEMQ